MWIAKHIMTLNSIAFITIPATNVDKLLQTTNAELDGRTIAFVRSSGRTADERQTAEPTAVIIAKSLSWNTDDASLMAHFEGCLSARVIVDRETGQSKGYVATVCDCLSMCVYVRW